MGVWCPSEKERKEQLKSDIVVMKDMCWDWHQLMDTPVSVYTAIVENINESARQLELERLKRELPGGKR